MTKHMNVNHDVSMYLASTRLEVGPHASRLQTIWTRNTGRIAVIGAALDHETREVRSGHIQSELDALAGRGLDPEEMDLTKYFDGPRDAARDIAQTFDGVWVPGGNTFNLRRAMRQSGLDHHMPALFDGTGRVYAGYSAGSCLVAERGLATIDGLDDPNEIPEGLGYTREIIDEGLGFTDVLIMPHYGRAEPGSLAQLAVEAALSQQRALDIPYLTLSDGQAIIAHRGEQELLV